MQLKKICSGNMANNTYVLIDENAQKGIIIDPAQKNTELFEFVKDLEGEVYHTYLSE